MQSNLVTLQNKHWQIGILPETGASIAFGRVRYAGAWLDVMRPTDPENYDNSSLCSSFIMLPWANRIGRGEFRFDGEMHQLKTTPDDDTARHGDVRKRVWKIQSQTETSITLSIQSNDFTDMNFPFQFSATVEYRLDDADFIVTTTLTNNDERRYPAGFGHHPYFVRTHGDNAPQIQFGCEAYYKLDNGIPQGGGIPVTSEYDFRELRTLTDELVMDNLYGQRDITIPTRIIYPKWQLELDYQMDVGYEHIVFFAPEGKPFFALEPQTNANDGFTLHEQGVDNTGVFFLKPDESKTLSFTLSLNDLKA